MKRNLKLILVILFLSKIINYGQQPEPNQILDSVKEEFSKIEDYTVDITIDIDVEFLKAPQSKAKIYYKKPGKIKMDSEGFAMLPKQGLDFSPAKLLEGDFTAIYSKPDSNNGIPLHIIKVIPDNDSSGIILSKLWVDSNQKVIRQIETTSKSGGTFTIELFYTNSILKILPSKVLFRFNLGGIELPGSFTGNFDPDTESEKKGKGPIEGTVTVKYENYLINQGLSDSIFKKENE